MLVVFSCCFVCRVAGSAGDVPARTFQLAQDGAVDDLVTDLDADAADDLLVDDQLELDRLAVDALQGSGEPVALGLVEVAPPR